MRKQWLFLYQCILLCVLALLGALHHLHWSFDDVFCYSHFLYLLENHESPTDLVVWFLILAFAHCFVFVCVAQRLAWLAFSFSCVCAYSHTCIHRPVCYVHTNRDVTLLIVTFISPFAVAADLFSFVFLQPVPLRQFLFFFFAVGFPSPASPILPPLFWAVCLRCPTSDLSRRLYCLRRLRTRAFA